MKCYKTVDGYISNAQNGKEILIIFRKLLKEPVLTELNPFGKPHAII